MKGYVDEQINETKKNYDKKIDAAIDTLREQLRGELREALIIYAGLFHARIECLKTFLGLYKTIGEKLKDRFFGLVKDVIQGTSSAVCGAVALGLTAPATVGAVAAGAAAGGVCYYFSGRIYDDALKLFNIVIGEPDGRNC